MEDLPGELLCLIARQVLEKEEGMRLWCRLASTCTRLWSFQLPAEPAYRLSNRVKKDGLPWTLGRLQDARKLSLTVGWVHHDKPYLESDVARALMQATHALTKLETLELHIDEFADVLQDRHAWVRTLLLGATGLTALSTSIDTLPRSPIMQHLPLRRLEIVVSYSSRDQVERCFADISRCLTLESLKVSGNVIADEPDFIGPPSIHLHSMPRLKHVKVEDYLDVGALSLPAACSLFLDVSRSECLRWHEHQEMFQSHTTVLRHALGDDTAWPSGIQDFVNLKYLELCVRELYCQDLACLRHIPHVRIVSHDEEGSECVLGAAELQLTSGSWQSLEVLFFGELALTINDVDSHVRDTRSFTFSAEHKLDHTHWLFEKILSACQRHGKACHYLAHKAELEDEEITYVTLSTSKEVAENFSIIYDDDHEEGPAIGLWGERTFCHWQDFWPSDPCASVKWA